MVYKVYVIVHNSVALLYEDEDCADFYIKYMDNSYVKYVLPITSDSSVYSTEVLTLKMFIDIIEKTEFHDTLFYECQKANFLNDFGKLKIKLRDNTLNRILNE